jgi:hypothetical protein
MKAPQAWIFIMSLAPLIKVAPAISWATVQQLVIVTWDRLASVVFVGARHVR